MTVWKTIPVEDQPELTIVRWAIAELNNGDRHLVGYVTENHEGRVSSTITEFDAEHMTARTHSGRVYQLKGPQGSDPDGIYTWMRWLAAYDLGDDDYRWVLSTEL